jgi:hypothetical protein
MSATAGNVGIMKAPSDTLMLTGVVRYCTDCDGDRIFVEPFSDDTGWAELACTDCGAAMLVDSEMFIIVSPPQAGASVAG